MKLTHVVSCLWMLILPAPAVSQETLPNPVLFFTGTEAYEAGGATWTRYKYAVANPADYPDELFAAAPELPPCGTNTQSSRTWVDFFTQSGKRLYGFCALGSSDNLSKIWFALERDAIPPSWIYIELTDRQTNSTYKSIWRKPLCDLREPRKNPPDRSGGVLL